MSNPNNPNVNPREFDSELQAVWFAANYYYEASFTRGQEYSGLVFQRPNGKFSITVRREGQFHTSTIHLEDVPEDGDLYAVWHTHLPYSRLTRDDDLKTLARAVEEIEGVFGGGFENFSVDDRRIAEELTEQALKLAGVRVPIYLVTATLIKRYTPGAKTSEKEWRKSPPSRMKKIW